MSRNNLQRFTSHHFVNIVNYLFTSQLQFQEIALCCQVRDLLNKTDQQIGVQMVELRTIKARMESDWSDKIHTYNIDSVCMNLLNDSPLLLWKAGATRLPAE